MIKDIIITKDKDLIRHLIFDGVEEEAVKICKELKKHNLRDGWAAFGLYLYETMVRNEEVSLEITRRLQKIKDMPNEQTAHVLIVLQEVFKYIAATASEEFKQKVEIKE